MICSKLYNVPNTHLWDIVSSVSSLLIAQDKYSDEDATLVLNSKEVALTVVMERLESMENFNPVDAVSCLDILLAGQMNPSRVPGILGQWDDPKYVEVLGVILTATRCHEKQRYISGLKN
jgi:2-keto-3-deoxy-L-rhamnonate aldolase RhmA